MHSVKSRELVTQSWAVSATLPHFNEFFDGPAATLPSHRFVDRVAATFFVTGHNPDPVIRNSHAQFVFTVLIVALVIVCAIGVYFRWLRPLNSVLKDFALVGSS